MVYATLASADTGGRGLCHRNPVVETHDGSYPDHVAGGATPAGQCTSLFPVLHVADNKREDGTTTTTRIHESLAICEYVAELLSLIHI